MANKEYGVDFVLGAKQNAEFGKAFKSAQSQVAAMQKEIVALNRAQSDIKAYAAQQAAIAKTAKDIEVYNKQLANIKTEQEAASKASSELANAELQKERQIEKANEKLAQQNERLTALKQKLEGAEINVGDLAGEQARLARETEGAKKAQEGQAAAAEKQAKLGEQAAIAAVAAAAMIKATKEFFGAAYAAAGAAMEFESALAGVDKTSDLTRAELAGMGRELQIASTQMPIAAAELAGVAEAAGQLGIAKNHLLDFSETMSMLGIATNLTAEEAATQIAQFANITKMSADDYGRFGSVIVALGNNFATTERDIVNMSKNLAAAGDMAGISQANIAAIATTLASLGVEAQAGGTAISKLMREFETLIATQSDDLAGFAEVAGMTAREFADAWGRDAMGALSAFVEGLAALDASGKSSIAALTDLGVTESRQVDALTRMANAGGLLSSAVAQSNAAWSDNTALVNEANKRFATTESQAAMAANAFQRLKVAIGDAYTPTLREAYSLGKDLFNSLADYAAENPEVVRAITVTVGVLGVAAAGIAAYTAAVKFAAMANKAFHASLGPIALAIGAVAAVVGVVTLAVSKHEAAMLAARDTALDYTAASREQYREIQALEAEYRFVAEASGEHSDAALRLRGELEALNAEYAGGIQTVGDYYAEMSAAHKSYSDMIKAHADAQAAIYTEDYSVQSLIGRLESLSATSADAARNQTAILAIIEKLNAAVPGLNLAFDDVANNERDSLAAIRAAAEAELGRRQQELRYSKYVDELGAQATTREAVEKARKERDLAAAALDAAQAELSSYGKYIKTATGQTVWNVDAPETVIRNVAELHNQLLAIYNGDDENAGLNQLESDLYALDASIAEAESAWRSEFAAQQEAERGFASLETVIGNATGQMSALAAAYKEAYDAALVSVTGQYKLWDEAAKVNPIEASSINKGLEQQTAYWQKYKADLDYIAERASGIEGLSAMLAAIPMDGSAESRNLIAGIRKGIDEGGSSVADMVKNYQALQEEQKKVSEAIAQVNTDYAAAMGELKTQVEADIMALDLSSLAAEKGRSTIQGYIDGISSMYAPLQSEAQRLADIMLFAAQYKPDGFYEPGRSGLPGYGAYIPGYASGTMDAPGAFIAGEAGPELIVGRRGARVFPHAETRQIVEAVRGYGIDGVSVSVSPTYYITAPDAEGVLAELDAQNDRLKDMLIEAMQEVEYDNRRRAFS